MNNRRLFSWSFDASAVILDVPCSRLHLSIHGIHFPRSILLIVRIGGTADDAIRIVEMMTNERSDKCRLARSEIAIKKDPISRREREHVLLEFSFRTDEIGVLFFLHFPKNYATMVSYL